MVSLCQLTRPVLGISLVVSQLLHPVFGQVAPPPTGYEDEIRRAEKEGNKVFDWIRKHAPAPRKVTTPPKPPPTPKRVAVPEKKPVSVAVPVAEPAPQSSVATNSNQADSQPLAASGETPAVINTEEKTGAVDAYLLFDFEQGIDGFHVNDAKQWGAVDAATVATTEGGAHGLQALRVYSPRESWVGHEFDASQDWSKFKNLTFAVRSAQGFGGRIAIKSGDNGDWCESTALRVGETGNFLIYRVSLLSEACPTINLSAVQGLHLSIHADDTVILDEFRFEP